ncbi:hypothetical protein H9Y04_26665 [Streptomyces sp. TRM66268-LWL]|uniref:DUF3592 domain-containing protein n=1 Tax=Streptomyces polyasparticus TaxID=2767826 RepID=A0ABR7SN56_9ACTN|nr:hypothetical protein [Streptomyces polyasparticus]MBC9716125.1 hypothetical protein [Streptomyces polyasparticus]
MGKFVYLLYGALTWGVRLCAVGTCVAVSVAGILALGALSGPPPLDGALAWGWVAAGCALGRPVLLWIRKGVDEVSWRWPYVRRPAFATGRVSLSKHGEDEAAEGERWWPDEEPEGPLGAPVWVKLRRCLALIPVAIASAAVFGLLGAGLDEDGAVARMQREGAVATVGTVAEAPRGVRESRDDEGVLHGYWSDLTLQVPAADRPLPARHAYTEAKPARGDRVELLWAPGRPGWGAHVDETDDMSARAETRWELFPARGPGEGNLFVLVLMGVVVLAFGLPLTLAAEYDELHEQAWSPLAQTGYGVVAAGVFLLQRPVLLGSGVPDNSALALATWLCFLAPMGLQIVHGARTFLR